VGFLSRFIEGERRLKVRTNPLQGVVSAPSWSFREALQGEPKGDVCRVLLFIYEASTNVGSNGQQPR
jgi:hypothetical protein